MNIFNTIKNYAGKWSVSNIREFSAEEKAAIDRAEVVDSQYGNSVCFFLKNGGMAFIPLSQNSTLGVGAKVDVEKAKLLTLSKSGEDDINRVEI